MPALHPSYDGKAADVSGKGNGGAEKTFNDADLDNLLKLQWVLADKLADGSLSGKKAAYAKRICGLKA